jgi:hypothetical protein
MDWRIGEKPKIDSFDDHPAVLHLLNFKYDVTAI